jgi:hypothetical protein
MNRKFIYSTLKLNTGIGDNSKNTVNCFFSQNLQNKYHIKAGSSKTPTWSKAKSKPENPLPSSLSRSKDSEDSDNDDKVPIPIFRESFGDAIQTALETHMAKSKGIEDSLVYSWLLTKLVFLKNLPLTSI